MTDFDKVIQRRGTNCIKWDLNPLKDRADVIPMWVADMDFEAAPGIINAMQKVMDHKIFGYRFNSPEYKQVIIDCLSADITLRRRLSGSAIFQMLLSDCLWQCRAYQSRAMKLF